MSTYPNINPHSEINPGKNPHILKTNTRISDFMSRLGSKSESSFVTRKNQTQIEWSSLIWVFMTSKQIVCLLNEKRQMRISWL